MMFRSTSLRIAAGMLALASITACSKKDDDTPAPAATPVGMSWTMDGTNVTATKASKDASASTNTISLEAVNGTAADSPSLSLIMPKAAGTYTIGSTTNTGAFYDEGGANGKTYASTSGSIVVSSLTATNVIGTFTFTGRDIAGTATKTITNGKFNVAL